LPHIRGALYNVNEVRFLDVFNHCLENRLNRSFLLPHLIKLRVEILFELFFLFLFLFEVLPELSLQSINVLLGQLKELLCSDLLLLVEVTSELKFVFDVSNRVVNVLIDALDFRNFLVCYVLQHL
jgi:hypothetical protein